MDLYYSETLKMPAVYSAINDDEMSYVEGGGSAVVYDSATGIRNRLTTIIASSITGGSAATALGALLGGPAGAVVSAIIAGGYFDSYRSAASDAHSKAESIISKYGANKLCKMTTTYSFAYYCTGISVNVA